MNDLALVLGYVQMIVLASIVIALGTGWVMRCIREKRISRAPARIPYVTECNPWACYTCHVRGHTLSDCYQHADSHRGHVVSRLDVYLRAMSKGVKS